jgi:myo-inositol 2-dehydrogenase / D-chiro-inositol 1-dehydrogenase
MRIGLVGVGRIGAFHASTLASLEQVEKVVVTDAFPEAAERLAADAGYEFSTDLDALLDSVDGLVITTSTDAHAATLRRGVAAGLPTFCEKPVARTLEETVQLVDLVEATGVPVHVSFQRRFDAGYRRAR